MSWGPWIDDHLPNIGDYIEMFIWKEDNNSVTDSVKGTVTDIDEHDMIMLAPAPDLADGWEIVKWRKKALSAKGDILRKLEVTT